MPTISVPEDKIYLDCNGTTPLAPEVRIAIARSLDDDWGNPSTSHELGKRARAQIESARRSVASLVGGLPHEIIFTSGGTESNNMTIMGICQRKNAEDTVRRHVITTNVEHDSVLLPLKYLQETDNLQVTEVDVSDIESLVQNILSAIKDNTVLITIMAANNETGVIMPLREIGHGLKNINQHRQTLGLTKVFFHSDGAQILGKEPVDVNELTLDCFTIVGHKFYGPRIGALWTRINIPPLLFGGGCKNRPGTENTPMIVGLGVAAELVTLRLENDRKKMLDMRYRLENLLQTLPVPVKINCSSLPRLVNTCNASFGVPHPLTGSDILSGCSRILAGVGAACHSGSTTASRVLVNSGVPLLEAATSIRLSFGRDTNCSVEEIVNDIDASISSLLNSHVKS